MSIISVEGVDITVKKKKFWISKNEDNKFDSEYKEVIFFGEDRKTNVYLDMLEERIRFYIKMN